MTTEEYLKTLEKLDLLPAWRTAIFIGLKVRQCQRIAAGLAPVPETVAILLDLYLKMGKRHFQRYRRLRLQRTRAA
jgi:tRNA isopentenyl-2-thiomethyl-A-37 hydroxylase MiaE